MEIPETGVYTCELGVLDENIAVLTIRTPIDEPQRSYKLIPADDVRSVAKAFWEDTPNPQWPAH